MTRFLLALLSLTVFTSCRTVEVPLSGVMVGRPNTLGSQIGIRSTAGVVQAPKVQGVVEEVRDSEGKVVNPVASESTGDARMQLPLVELGIGFARQFEFGVSTNRGLNGMIDLYRGNVWSASISGSSVTSTFSIKKEDKTGKTTDTTDDTEKEKKDVFKSVDDLTGMSSNNNVTLLTAARVGNQVWAQLNVYAGIGINQFTVEISDLDTNDTKRKSQLAPSALMGLQGKLTIFEVSCEVAGIKIRERNHQDKFIPLGLLTFTTRFDYFGSNSSATSK